MSFWTDAAKAFRDIALLNDKVERALAAANDAKNHAVENRERVGQIETAINFIMREQDSQRRLPPN